MLHGVLYPEVHVNEFLKKNMIIDGSVTRQGVGYGIPENRLRARVEYECEGKLSFSIYHASCGEIWRPGSRLETPSLDLMHPPPPRPRADIGSRRSHINQVVPQPVSRVIYCSIGGYKRPKLRLMHRPGTVEGVCSIHSARTRRSLMQKLITAILLMGALLAF